MPLEDRRDEMENRFAHDEAHRFRVVSRRNRLVGEWAAGQMGKSGEAAATYAASLVSIGTAPKGDVAVAETVIADLKAAGVADADAQFQRQMAVARDDAERQLRAE